MQPRKCSNLRLRRNSGGIPSREEIVKELARRAFRNKAGELCRDIMLVKSMIVNLEIKCCIKK